jgi:hypothetical protein
MPRSEAYAWPNFAKAHVYASSPFANDTRDFEREIVSDIALPERKFPSSTRKDPLATSADCTERKDI